MRAGFPTRRARLSALRGALLMMNRCPFAVARIRRFADARLSARNRHDCPGQRSGLGCGHGPRCTARGGSFGAARRPHGVSLGASGPVARSQRGQKRGSCVGDVAPAAGGKWHPAHGSPRHDEVPRDDAVRAPRVDVPLWIRVPIGDLREVREHRWVRFDSALGLSVAFLAGALALALARDSAVRIGGASVMGLAGLGGGLQLLPLLGGTDTVVYAGAQ
jgi:hypothetical protein